jgi:hypothetical protein
MRMGIRKKLGKRIKSTIKKKKVRKAVKKGLTKGYGEWVKFRDMAYEQGVKSAKAASKLWKRFKKDNKDFFKRYGKYPKATVNDIKKLIKKR